MFDLKSKDVVNAVSYFKVDQDLRFSSDHAPVSMWLNMDALGIDGVEALTYGMPLVLLFRNYRYLQIF